MKQQKITERDERFYSSVDTWKRAFKISLGSKQRYEQRLTDLTTWDKPLSNDNDSTKDEERQVKITALQLLINNY